MQDWRIKDTAIICYNLQNKITPYEAEMEAIARRARAIRKKEKCDELTAYRILRKQLEAELGKKA
jgi:hypothetical protein